MTLRGGERPIVGRPLSPSADGASGGVGGPLCKSSIRKDLRSSPGARRVARLPLSIASHSALMEPAAKTLNELFDDIVLDQPRVPLVANSTGQRLNTAEEIREELRYHVVRGVDWTTSVQTMIGAGITTFVEIGPGNVLAGLNKRIDKSVTTLSLKDLELPTA